MIFTKSQSTTKVCTKCKKRKPFEKFSRNKKSSDGHHWWCKDCANEQVRKYNDRRRVKILPSFICPKCGEEVKLKFYPTRDLKKWNKFRCPKCKYSPYGNK